MGSYCFASPKGSHRRLSGFTLLEVLVAFTVISLVLGTSLRVLGNGLRAGASSAEHTRAVILARSRLATLEAARDLESGITEGAVDDVYRWRISLEPYPPGDGAGADTDLVTPLLATVEIAWGDGPRARTVRLDTLLLAGRRR